jgi:hypothetical protein
MPKKVTIKVTKGRNPKRGVRRVRGQGAYYPGGMSLRGKGGFFQDVGSFFKKAAGPLLGAAGGIANTIWPGSGMVADGIRKLIGAGAYSPVRSNAILAQPVPRVNSSQDVGITYSHCEFLGDVTGSENWELTQFHVNPGLSECFPWLSGVASNFQKYRIDGLVFYIRSTSSVAIASSTDLGLGTVLGGFQTNVYDKAPASKLEFLSLSGARSGKPSEDHIYPMECDRSKNVFGNLLVRTVGVADDMAKYDHAVFNLATVGFPGSYYLGELWVSYKLTLMAPKVESAVPSLTTIPLGATEEERQRRAWNSTTMTSGNAQWFVHSPPVTDDTQVLNYAGWSTGTGTDGYPCTSIPSGTTGYFLVDIHRDSSNAESKMGDLHVDVIDNSGVFVKDTSTWYGDAQIGQSGNNYFGSSCWAYRVNALPDKPLKVRFYTINDMTATGVQYSINVVRLPDKIFATSSSSSTVSLAQKVQRITRSRSYVAALGARSVDAKTNSAGEEVFSQAQEAVPAATQTSSVLVAPVLTRQTALMSRGSQSLQSAVR